MNRRLKDRIPPAALARVKRVPWLVLVVTTTIFVSPEAWARVVNGEADVFVKTYSKDELAKKLPPNPMVGLDQRLLQELTGVLNRVSGQLAGTDQQNAVEGLKTAQPTKGDWTMNAALLTDAPATKGADQNAIRTFFAGESQKALSATAKTKFDFVNKIGNGMAFNLKLGEKTTGPDAQQQSGEVRYGLVVKDIVPDMNAPRRASVSDPTSELDYAGHADVKWTIGPLTEDHGRKLFTAPPPAEEPGTTHPLLEGLHVPSPNFSGRATPENFENFAKVSKENQPAWRFELVQEEGLYAMTYKTKPSGERLSVEHAFRMPIAGTVAFGRRFSDNWDVVETSAYNILYDKRLPLLSVHHMHIEKRYKAELAQSFGRHTVGVGARGKTEDPAVPEAERPEGYSVNYTTDF